ncbi:MAG TPA: hypothetical protein VNN80_28450 [Polyangiaceae bacterium]|nr:hypothetical protein [Polyangiaceae bacterium]
MRTLAALGALLVACASDASAPGDGAPSVPAGWVRVQAVCGYGFHAPPDVMMRALVGIDSCIDGWSASSCAYTGDYGGYSSDLTEYEGSPQYQETRESIDGRDAKLVTLADEGLVAAVHFASVDPAVPGLRLTVGADCQDAAGQQDALTVFRSIRFARTP